MRDEIARLIEPLDRGAPITDEALQTLSRYVADMYGRALPEDYVAFLRLADGADGALAGGNAIVLWEAGELPGVQRDLETDEHMPGFFVIGSDSGDYLYGIDLRKDAPAGQYLETEDAAMDWDYILWHGESFLELLRYADRPATPAGGGRLSFPSRLVESLRRLVRERPRADR
ncbi:MAG TPA: SMI1/KNR4 family protein [Dehalococcoidia bacterium]|nr:SMI1/KNR4 family protein [Dehalococcoidia bacterium]